jgi:hypothetical protein
VLLQTNIKPRRRTIKLQARTSLESDRWVWPLPAIEAAKPRVLAHGADSRLGVELGYADNDTNAVLVPVYAVHRGTIQLARQTASGFAMVIDHGDWSTYYGRLHRMTCSPTWDEGRPKHRVLDGQIIGYTTSATPIRFELWRWTDDAGFVPTPPEPIMSAWSVLTERAINAQPNQIATPNVAA